MSNKTNKQFVDNTLKETSDFVVFRVDTNKIDKRIKFYTDPNFPKGQAVFTYVNIPRETIDGCFEFQIDEENEICKTP